MAVVQAPSLSQLLLSSGVWGRPYGRTASWGSHMNGHPARWDSEGTRGQNDKIPSPEFTQETGISRAASWGHKDFPTTILEVKLSSHAHFGSQPHPTHSTG